MSDQHFLVTLPSSEPDDVKKLVGDVSDSLVDFIKKKKKSRFRSFAERG